MKVIIVGATGYIGSRLHQDISESLEVIGTSSSGGVGLAHLDLEAPSAFDRSLIGAGDVVVVTAAISAPDVCASRYDYAYQVNVRGTSEFIETAFRRGANVLFFSSDTVYGGSEAPLTEASPCHPIGEYGIMKHALEKLFLGDPRFKTIRLSYVFSREDKFSKYLANSAQTGKVADIFHPFYRSAIYLNDVVAGVRALALEWDRFQYPIINFGGPEMTSRISIAENLRACALPALKYNVTEPEPTFFQNRPRYINMLSDLLPIIIGNATRTIKQAIFTDYGHSI